MKTVKYPSATTQRLALSASYKQADSYAHPATSDRPAFTPADIVPHSFHAYSTSPVDQWGVLPLLAGNWTLMSVVRVPVSASCTVVAHSTGGVSAYLLTRKRGDSDTIKRAMHGFNQPVPIQPSRQKAGASVESGPGVINDFGVAGNATFHVPAAPVNRDIVIMGVGDLSVEVYTDNRQQKFVNRSTTAFDLGGAGDAASSLLYEVIPVKGTDPWYCISRRKQISNPSPLSPYVHDYAWQTVTADGAVHVPTIPNGDDDDAWTAWFPHRLMDVLLERSKMPLYNGLFSVIGICFAPDATWRFHDSTPALSSNPRHTLEEKDIFIIDDTTYNPGTDITLETNYTLGCFGAAN